MVRARSVPLEGIRGAISGRTRQERRRDRPPRELIDKGPVTLLYGAHDEAHNNAVALRAYLDSKREG